MNGRSRVAILGVVLLVAFIAQMLHAEDLTQNKPWKKFTGAWFEVLHPVEFSAEPSLKSATNVSGHDSAFFVSPGKEVSFYVFSPQWNGEPTDILLKDSMETQVSQDRKEKDGVVVIECVIAAKDGSYKRSYTDVSDTTTNTRKVFGFSYRDQKIFDQYKDRYERFKSSLVQFAD